VSSLLIWNPISAKPKLRNPPVFRYFTMDNFLISKLFSVSTKDVMKEGDSVTQKDGMEGYKDLTLVVLSLYTSISTCKDQQLGPKNCEIWTKRALQTYMILGE
jgi:hypothetical protein